MKIGITCYPTYGGSGAVATELGIGLADRGHEVHFISYAQPFRLSGFRKRVYFHEVEMERYPLFEYPHYTLALAAAIHDTALRESLDLIHVHYAIPHATSAWIAREMLEENGGPPSSPPCTAPMSRWWGCTLPSIPSRASRSCAPRGSPRSRTF